MASRWAEDADSRFGRSRPAAPVIPDIPTPVDATSICDAIKEMYVDMREKRWMSEARPLYDCLGECLDMLYVDRHAWRLKEQSDNYAEVMTRVKECLKRGYAACQTQTRVYVYVPYDTYATFVDICHMCGRYLHDTEMSQYVKMSREPYTDRQTKELHIVALEDLKAELVEANKMANHWQNLYYELRLSSTTENEELKKELKGERARLATLMTEIEELKQNRSPAQNTDPKPPQEDSVVKPRSGFLSRFRRKSQCSSITSLLADLSHLSDREHIEGSKSLTVEFIN